MTALEQLNAYLKLLELRVRLFAASRGAALIAVLALALTVLLVWISNRYAFAQSVVLPLRIVLFLALAVSISFLLAIPLLKLNRRRVTRLVEQRIPNFGERLLTVAEKPDPANPFTELVAEDALRIAREHNPEQVAPARSLWGFLGSSVVAALVLIWLIAAGPGYWGYGASLLWTGSANPGKRPLYDIGVRPGNKTIRRKSDQVIIAQLFGFSARNVTLHAKYGAALKWEQTTMQPKADGNTYQFLFAASCRSHRVLRSSRCRAIQALHHRRQRSACREAGPCCLTLSGRSRLKGCFAGPRWRCARCAGKPGRHFCVDRPAA